VFVGGLVLSTAVAFGQQGPLVRPDAAYAPPGAGEAPRVSADQPLRVAGRSDLLGQAKTLPPTVPIQALPNEHPLMPALRWAQQGLPTIEGFKDYSTTLVKRERVNGKVGDYEYLFVKVRQKPFSVYLYFLSPAAIKGQEVIFVQGQNNGNMWAHTVGVQDKLVGTLSLKPDGMIAMRGQRYPLTEIGLANLVHRLVEVASQDVNYGECEVKFFPGAKINNRTCTCIQATHPVPRRNFLFHLARIFVDDQLNVPVRYEAYDWPKEPGAQPELIEEYTYLNLKINNGFTDEDFSIKNPNYRFH
jgi:hypothetical protein